jgi:hypothetical protein
MAKRWPSLAQAFVNHFRHPIGACLLRVIGRWKEDGVSSRGILFRVMLPNEKKNVLARKLARRLATHTTKGGWRDGVSRWGHGWIISPQDPENLPRITVPFIPDRLNWRVIYGLLGYGHDVLWIPYAAQASGESSSATRSVNSQTREVTPAAIPGVTRKEP